MAVVVTLKILLRRRTACIVGAGGQSPSFIRHAKRHPFSYSKKSTKFRRQWYWHRISGHNTNR